MIRKVEPPRLTVTESCYVETTPLNVKLVPAAAADLEAEKKASGMNGADVTNRALQLYHFLMEEERQGAEICVLTKRKRAHSLERVIMTDFTDD
jgi:hypothetical protein